MLVGSPIRPRIRAGFAIRQRRALRRGYSQAFLAAISSTQTENKVPTSFSCCSVSWTISRKPNSFMTPLRACTRR